MYRRWLLLSWLCMVALLGCATPPAHDVQTNSDMSETSRRANLRLQLASAYLEADQAATALDEVKQALQLDPNLPNAYHVRALAYMKLNENALAEQNFRRAMALKANDGDLLNNYGWFMCMQQRYDEAFRYFDQAQGTPSVAGPAKPLANAGVCSLRKGDDRSAEAYLVRATSYDFNNPVANLGLGQLYYKQAQFDRARGYVQRVNSSAAANAESLWLGARIAHKTGDRSLESFLVTQLRQRFPNSAEVGAFERGAWDE